MYKGGVKERFAVFVNDPGTDSGNDLMTHKLSLEVMAAELAVVQLDPATDIPAWALAGDLFSVTRTPDELSIVCRQELLPDGYPAQRGLRALAVKGPLEFTAVGILDSLARPLAGAGLSIFVISTYATDYVLIAESSLPQAREVLVAAGHTVIDAAQQ